MTNEEAKGILSAYRPDREDSGDRFFEDALRQAERDPELSRWFKEQRRFDRSVSAALDGIEVPAEARREVVAAARVEARVRQFPRLITGLAAALVLTGGLVFAWLGTSLSGNVDDSQAWLKEGDRVPEVTVRTRDKEPLDLAEAVREQTSLLVNPDYRDRLSAEEILEVAEALSR